MNKYQPCFFNIFFFEQFEKRSLSLTPSDSGSSTSSKSYRPLQAMVSRYGSWARKTDPNTFRLEKL
jgi:hypothetical protein